MKALFLVVAVAVLTGCGSSAGDPKTIAIKDLDLIVHNRYTEAWDGLYSRDQAVAPRVEYVGWPDDHQRIDIGSFKTDSGRIAADLGWISSIDIEVGMKQAIAFYEENSWYLSST